MYVEAYETVSFVKIFSLHTVFLLVTACIFLVDTYWLPGTVVSYEPHNLEVTEVKTNNNCSTGFEGVDFVNFVRKRVRGE